MRERWPLIGREDELSYIGERIAAGGSVVVAGAAGVGKTHLLDAALERAESDGRVVIRARGSQAATGTPFGAVASLLPETARPIESRLALLRLATATIAARGTGGRLVMGVDDAHLLDDASATLVHHLASHADVSVVTTIRSGESTPDALVLLWKDGVADRLELQALSRTQMTALCEAVLEGTVDGALIERLWALSQGNALYLHELVMEGMRSGQIRLDAGVWRSSGALHAPDRLAELMAERLRGVSPVELSVLEELAVCDAVSLSVLEGRYDAAVLQRLERSGLMTVTTDLRRRPARLSHPLYGEVLRERMPPDRARQIRLGMADMIEAAGARRRGDVLQVALLRIEAGGVASADLLARAAHDAYFTYDLALAERIARSALDAGAGWDTRRLLAEVLRFQGRYADADREIAAIDPRDTTEDGDIALVAMTRAENLFRGMGRFEDAVGVLDDAEARVLDEDWRAEIAQLRASFQMLTGRVPEAIEAALPACEGPAVRAMLWAALIAGFGLAVAGRSEEAVRVSDRAFGTAIGVGEQYLISHPGVHIVTRCVALAEAGRLEEARAGAEFGYEAAMANGLLLGQAWFGMTLGRVLLGQGRLVQADRILREGAIAFRDVHDPGPSRWCWAAVAQAAAMRGDVERAEAALVEMDAGEQTLLTLMQVEVERAHAWTAVVRGEDRRALELLAAAAGHARERGQFALEADALHDIARLGDAAAVEERIGELEALVDGPLMPARASHVRALVGRDAAGLDAVCASFEDLGACLLGAEAAAQASLLWSEADDRRAAAASAARARELAERCEGARTPPLGALESVALTEREREIATLASQGLTNRQIADRLVVSVRTVENHLQHVFRKLGIANRAELSGRIASEPE